MAVLGKNNHLSHWQERGKERQPGEGNDPCPALFLSLLHAH